MSNKPEKECSKVTAEEFVNHIEELGYFKYANPTHIPTLKQNFIENFDTNDELTSIWDEKAVGLGGIINVPKDYRYYFCDSEDLFEYGGVDFMLEGLTHTFKKIKFKCKISNHYEEWDKQNEWLNHKITINGTEYIIFKNFTGRGWGEASMRLAEILNIELEKQRIEERVYLISQANDGRLIFLSKDLYEFIYSVYKNNKWKPLEINEWCDVMGVKKNVITDDLNEDDNLNDKDIEDVDIN